LTSPDNAIPTFLAKGEVVLFDGFLKMYGTNKEEILPPLSVGDQLDAREITARQTFARPPARYTEGSLVKKLEELGIGRPSTYATIIGTIQTRGYAEKGDSDGEEREIIELKLVSSASSEFLPETADANRSGSRDDELKSASPKSLTETVRSHDEDRAILPVTTGQNRVLRENHFSGHHPIVFSAARPAKLP
jgi:hypothetical protein